MQSVSEADSQAEAAIVLAFLNRYLEDKARGTVRELEEYQASFRGYESVIEREFTAAQEGSEEVAPSPLEHLPREGEVSQRYERQEEIARGGMGRILRVWDRDLKRSLAMKVMATGKGTSASQGSSKAVSRFLQEAMITGQLEHPGIIPVHDLGIGADGHVYFTMSMVKGHDLQEIFEFVHSGRDDWTTTRALNVIHRVCEAVAFAHDKGVIHRDLKPSNVMVGRFGVTYVMDWGLARVTGGAMAEAAQQDEQPEPGTSNIDVGDLPPLLTLDGDVVGTPSYMAPEQAHGDLKRIGVQTDVYAIGAMLYHLLSGVVPYTGHDFKPTSQAVLALVRKTSPEPLHVFKRNIPPELIAICEKAMAREQDQRYPEVMHLADDLRAFLDNRVVYAYEAGAWAELRKWVRRNKRFAVACGLGVTALAIGLGLTLIEKDRADQTAVRLADEREWSMKFAFEILEKLGTDMATTELRDFPGGQKLRVRVLEDTKKFYKDFLAERGSDPRTRKQVARAYGSLATVQRHMGDYDDAQRSAKQAILIYEKLVEEEPASLSVALSLTRQQMMLASILAVVGKREAAVKAMEKNTEDLDSLAVTHPGDTGIRISLSATLHNLSIMYNRIGQHEKRDAAISKAMRLREKLVADSPKNERVVQRLASSYIVKVAYHVRTKDRSFVAELQSLSTKAELLYNGLIEQENKAEYRIGLSEVYTQRAFLLGHQRYDPKYATNAFYEHKKAFLLRDALSKEFPNVPQYVGAASASLSDMASQYHDSSTKKRPLVKQAISYSRRALAMAPNNATHLRYLRHQLGQLSGIFVNLKQHREAVEIIEQMLEFSPDKAWANYWAGRLFALCSGACKLDEKLTDTERHAQCESYVTQAMEHLRKACKTDSRSLGWLKDKRFNSIRDREEFVQLVAEIKAR